MVAELQWKEQFFALKRSAVLHRLTPVEAINVGNIGGHLTASSCELGGGGRGRNQGLRQLLRRWFLEGP